MKVKDVVPASHHDMLEATGTAALVTLDAQGRPQTTAVWYAVDDEGRLIMSITDARQKYRNIAGNSETDVFIIDPRNPLRTLEIRAAATLLPDPDHVGLAQVAAKYGISADELIALGGNRYTVVLTPRRVVANG